MSETKKRIEIGKRLCFILRHGMISMGLDCDLSGYVKVSDLVSKKLIDPITISELKMVVESNDKKRFSLILKNDEYFIKANQGHSQMTGSLIDDSISLELITEALPYCAHGTQSKFIDTINRDGLSRMSRKHIHLVSSMSNATQTSGFKNISDTIIVIDMQKCMDAGMVFYRSENGVILTKGIKGTIDSSYFLEVVPR